MNTDIYQLILDSAHRLAESSTRDLTTDLHAFQSAVDRLHGVTNSDSCNEIVGFLSDVYALRREEALVNLCLGDNHLLIKLIQERFIHHYWLETLYTLQGKQLDPINGQIGPSHCDHYLLSKSLGANTIATYYADTFHTTDKRSSFWGPPSNVPIAGFVLKLIAVSKGEQLDVQNFLMRRPFMNVFEPLFDIWDSLGRDDDDDQDLCQKEILRVLDFHWNVACDYIRGKGNYLKYQPSHYGGILFARICPLEILAYAKVRTELSLPTPLPSHAMFDSPWMKHFNCDSSYVYDELLVPVLEKLVHHILEPHPAFLDLCKLHHVHRDRQNMSPTKLW